MRQDRWWLTAAGVLVFNANTALAHPIKSASAALNKTFNEIDSALDDGEEISDAVRGARIKAVMHRVISHARTQGFVTAALHTKKKMPALYGRKILNAADNRSSKVQKMMKQTTRRVLRNTPDSEHVLSIQRAEAAVRFEAARSFFRGVRDGFEGTGWQKSWVTASGEPCPECEDNEDAGPIDVDDTFPSGDDYPLVHLNCFCSVAIQRGA